MNNTEIKKRWLPLGIAAGLAILVAGGLIVSRNNSTRAETHHADEHGEHDEHASSNIIEFDEASSKLAGIKVTEATLRKMATGITFNGQITAAPNATAQISSLVPGKVSKVLVAQGDHVKAGQTLAIVESQAIGEAQSAYSQAQARYQNASSHLSVVRKQAEAGVFSREPIEAARTAEAEAIGNLRDSEAAVRQARISLENVLRQAKAGAFASPALEAAKNSRDSATQALAAANAELARSKDQLQSAKAELNRRKQLAAAGVYGQKPVEEARRNFATAQAQLSAARSEMTNARTNQQRITVLSAEGLISKRQMEEANLAFDQAQSRLNNAESEVTAARQNYEREKTLAASKTTATAEVNAARSMLTDAESALKTRRAEMQHAQDALKLSKAALQREQVVYEQNIANRREISTARTTLEQAETAMTKARQQKAITTSALKREERIAAQNLNDISQLQAAQAEKRAAQADLKAARTTLSLMKSTPGGKAAIPIKAPIAGVIQERNISLGEVIDAETILMTLVNMTEVAMEAAIYEKDISKIRIGTSVSVNVDALPKEIFTGRITFIGSTLDPKTRTLTARALIDNPGTLRPGMFARGEIATGDGRQVISIPEDAVQMLDGKSVIFTTADEANHFEARPVVTGAKARGFIEITSGLEPAEKFVSEGAFVVKSQMMKHDLGGHGH